MCVKTFFPGDIGTFNPNGRGYALLQRGYEVSVDDNGYIVDARDPRTNKLYASDGSEVGTRNKPFESDDQREVKTDVRKKYTPEQKGEFIEGSDIWNALNAGRNVTLDERGTIVEIRDPATGKLYDNLGNETGKTATSGYPEGYEKEVKNPLRETYTLKDLGEFAEGGDMHNALTQSPDMQVTLDDKGFITDIWDSKTGKLYDIHGGDQGTRSDPYPSDNNIGDLVSAIAEINAQITALRAIRAALPKAARGALTAQIAALSAKRGHILYQWGRLQHRRRRMNEAYNKKQTKSTTKQK